MVEISIGPDEQGPGVSWAAVYRAPDGEYELLEAGGWAGTGPRQDESADAWRRLAQTRLRLPPQVKSAGLNWAQGSVNPLGWSQGGDHAPGGVSIVWHWLT